MSYKGFRLFCTGKLWYAVKDKQATGSYDSQAALCEAIRTNRVRLTPLPKETEKWHTQVCNN